MATFLALKHISKMIPKGLRFDLATFGLSDTEAEMLLAVGAVKRLPEPSRRRTERTESEPSLPVETQ